MTLALVLLAALQGTEADFAANSRRAVKRDAFPVLDNPKMVPADKADFLGESDPVIGVKIGDEARAYPVAIMGRHELANDTCGGTPIAVSW